MALIQVVNFISFRIIRISVDAVLSHKTFLVAVVDRFLNIPATPYGVEINFLIDTRKTASEARHRIT